jgi:hypothetical protein
MPAAGIGIFDFGAHPHPKRKPGTSANGSGCVGRGATPIHALGPVSVRSGPGGANMDFASYYLELFEMLNQACKKIASGDYDQQDAERLFELAKRERYPSLLADLAESFGMMMVKIEAREFKMKQMVEELEQAKARLTK